MTIFGSGLVRDTGVPNEARNPTLIAIRDSGPRCGYLIRVPFRFQAIRASVIGMPH